MRVQVKVDAARTSSEFKEARRMIRNRAKAGLLAAGRSVLPTLRRVTPSVVQDVLTVRASSSSAYLTTRGSRQDDRILGLLNYGGTVREAIAPKTKRAIKVGDTGAVVARVTTPRTYTGKHFLERGIEAAQPIYLERASDEVRKAFAGLYTSE